MVWRSVNYALGRRKVNGDNEGQWECEFEFEFEFELGRGKVDEFELKVNWEEGKLMMNTLNFWNFEKVFKVDKPQAQKDGKSFGTCGRCKIIGVCALGLCLP